MSWMFDACSWGCQMRRTIKFWEVFVTCFEEALERHRLGRLSAEEAGEALGMSGRQFRRLRVRYSAVGSEGSPTQVAQIATSIAEFGARMRMAPGS
ncbi:MAG: hypothetical protein EBY30_02275 [Rhodospirillales bacterium]|nr:hypothetical protein [Rhodospirillales bacterium]